MIFRQHWTYLELLYSVGHIPVNWDRLLTSVSRFMCVRSSGDLTVAINSRVLSKGLGRVTGIRAFGVPAQQTTAARGETPSFYSREG